MQGCIYTIGRFIPLLTFLPIHFILVQAQTWCNVKDIQFFWLCHIHRKQQSCAPGTRDLCWLQLMYGTSKQEAGGCILIFELHLYYHEVRRIYYTPLAAHLFCFRFKALECAASVPLPDFGTNQSYNEQLALRPTKSCHDRNPQIIPLIVVHKFSKSP